MNDNLLHDDGFFIETFSGKRINPLVPEKNKIDIVDIARSLSMQCRFNGHCRLFYSVAEHSFHTQSLLEKSGENLLCRLYGLLHDASEAYLCDVPRPLKHRFKDYIEWEKILTDIILEKLCGSVPNDKLWNKVMIADNTMLSIEASELSSSRGKNWICGESFEYYEKIYCWGPETAERKFLEIFEELISKI